MNAVRHSWHEVETIEWASPILRGEAAAASNSTVQRMSVPPRTWFITGSSSGFGRALAETLLARGHRVAGTARELNRVADLERRYPEAALPLALDVTEHSRVEGVVARAWHELGGIDVLCGNAGYGLIGGVEEISLEELRRQFAVNFFGAWAVIRAVLRRMRARRRGHILVMSSSGGVAGIPGAGAYSASKFALEGLSEALAGEVAEFGINVTIVEPGLFRTDFASRSKVEAGLVINEYDRSAGATRRAVRASAGRQPGDPYRAAEAMIAATEEDRPPRRLILGADARDQIAAKLARLQADVELWARCDVGFGDGEPAGTAS
jgi:NAD(P)-dependent dehydrogenase (short-subunit alcohol dehydrogenase family)